jgi:hypothetical protein
MMGCDTACYSDRLAEPKSSSETLGVANPAVSIPTPIRQEPAIRPYNHCIVSSWPLSK